MAIARDVVIVGIVVIGGYALIVWTLPKFIEKFAGSIGDPVSDAWNSFFPTSEQIQNEGLWPDSWPSTDDYFGEEGLWPDAWWP